VVRDDEYQQQLEERQQWLELYGHLMKGDRQVKVGEVYVSEGKSLRAEDLQGRARKLTIEKYGTVTFDGAEKVVLNFVGAKKGLILNVTNANRLVGNFGTDEIDEWIGKEVTLYPTTTEFNGKQVPCIRVKEEMPEIVEHDFDDDIPFIFAPVAIGVMGLAFAVSQYENVLQVFA